MGVAGENEVGGREGGRACPTRTREGALQGESCSQGRAEVAICWLGLRDRKQEHRGVSSRWVVAFTE